MELVQTCCLMVNELFQFNGKDNCFVLVIVLASVCPPGGKFLVLPFEQIGNIESLCR
jgi:hypothetical protein